MKLDRVERRKVMALAQARHFDAVLVTELSRRGRSTTDLLATLKELESRRVSVITLKGIAFDLATPHGRMIATVLAGIMDFEIAQGRSDRLVGREVGLSKNIVADIVKRSRTSTEDA